MKDWWGNLCERITFPPLNPLPLEAVLQCEKTDFLRRGERRSGGKDLERQPLTVHTQRAKRMKTFNFIQETIFHNLKDPHSKALEPDCLSPPLFAIATQSPRGENIFLEHDF